MNAKHNDYCMLGKMNNRYLDKLLMNGKKNINAKNNC